MSKRVIRALFFPLILTGHLIATFVVWMMEDEIKLSQAWRETSDD